MRSFGVTTNPDGTLRLEERGSVYNEMTSSSANRYSVLFRTAGNLVYGSNHPLAYNSGGKPSGIRTMKPEDIRNFHAANYYLANMGTLVAFPKSVPVEEVLDRTDRILTKVESEPQQRPSTMARPFPPVQAAPPATIAVADYPHRNDQQPSPLAFIWPATRGVLSADDVLLLELFGEAFAGDATTNLYKLFVDSKTRVIDVGATSTFSNIDRDPGHAVAFILDNAAVSNFTNDRIAAIRQKVMDELNRVASFGDGSAELKEFNARVMSRVIETERQLANFVNTPPAWGARGTGSAWMDQLLLLERTPEFRKSVTLAPQMASIRKFLSSDKNVWREQLAKWQLTGVTPYAAAARPSPALLQTEEQERVARAEAETKRLAAQYQLADEQAALRRYLQEQDAEAARIEEEAKKITPPSFVKDPPMSLDEDLRYAQKTLGSGVPIVTSTFDNMTAATAGLALRVEGVPRDLLRYVSLLPALLTRTGVVGEKGPIPYEEMSERLRNEILRLEATYVTHPRSERVELTLRGAGIGAEEAKRAIDWMSLVLHAPDWRVENLPRIRDVVDQSLSGLRNRMQGSEESWVNNPANVYRMQSRPEVLAADSFLTAAHNALRLKWLLKDVSADDRAALTQWFDALAQRTNSHAELKALLGNVDKVAGLSESAQKIAAEATKDLDLTLLEVPDGSLAADWKYLVTAMRDDLLTPPSEALAKMNALRRHLLHRGNARMWLVTSTAIQKALAGSIETLSASLDAATAPRAASSNVRHVDGRLLARDATAKQPVYVGLLAPNMKGGVIITSVPSATYADANSREKQIDYLAGRLYAGYGAHGVFLKTLAAGLAYSNGFRGSVQMGRVGYYAERTPEIPQTVKFVVETIRGSAPDPRLADYTVAQVFGETRAAGTYEARAEAIASDLTEGQPPAQVRRFRESILALRNDPKLAELLFARKDAVYAQMLPGYDPNAPQVPGAIYFAIGADKQLDAWEGYLKAKLYRLYPRDYWM